MRLVGNLNLSSSIDGSTRCFLQAQVLPSYYFMSSMPAMPVNQSSPYIPAAGGTDSRLADVTGCVGCMNA